MGGNSEKKESKEEERKGSPATNIHNFTGSNIIAQEIESNGFIRLSFRCV